MSSLIKKVCRADFALKYLDLNNILTSPIKNFETMIESSYMFNRPTHIKLSESELKAELKKLLTYINFSLVSQNVPENVRLQILNKIEA